MKKFFSVAVILLTALAVNAQVDSTWIPQTHLTGYVNTIGEYTDLKNWVDAKQDVGIGLSEAAFLASYKPLKKLEFKGTFVYTHFIQNIQSLIVEGYGAYTIDDALKLSAGKYLTPLSPVNQYFYAPLNPSATLPMLVSHHFLLPQSIEGFQVSGETGRDFKAGYNITYGTYLNLAHPQQGMIGIQGMEDYAVYLTAPPALTAQYLLGGSGRVYVNYNDIIKIGLNYFDGRRSTQPVQQLTAAGITTFFTPATKYSMGVDMQLKLAAFKINGEYWYGEQHTTDIPTEIKNTYKGYYGELIYEAGIFSPYVRYDYTDDVKASLYMPFPTTQLFNAEFPTTAYTVGIAARPIYEVLLKFEYRYIDAKTVYSDVNIPAPLQAKLPPSNPLNITLEKYDYFILSLVYSF